MTSGYWAMIVGASAVAVIGLVPTEAAAQCYGGTSVSFSAGYDYVRPVYAERPVYVDRPVYVQPPVYYEPSVYVAPARYATRSYAYRPACRTTRVVRTGYYHHSRPARRVVHYNSYPRRSGVHVSVGWGSKHHHRHRAVRTSYRSHGRSHHGYHGRPAHRASHRVSGRSHGRSHRPSHRYHHRSHGRHHRGRR